MAMPTAPLTSPPPTLGAVKAMARWWKFGLLAALLLLIAIGPAASPDAAQASHAAWDGIVQPGVHAGDTYRILFVTSTNVELTDAERTDIADWNAAVQAVADTQTAFSDPDGNAQTDDGISIKILGSTASVDARDNTNTQYRRRRRGRTHLLS